MSVVCCWSAKGGVGATIVAASLALAARTARPRGALLVDLAGDLPATFGVAADDDVGLADWLTTGPSAPPDALARLERRLVDGVALVPRGRGVLDPDGADLLVQVLGASGRPVIIDAGRLPTAGTLSTLGAELAARADASLLVSGTDRVALARAESTRHRVTGVVLVGPRRPADRRRLADVRLPAPVVAVADLDPRVRATLGTGLAHSRLPAGLRRTMAELALAIFPASP